MNCGSRFSVQMNYPLYIHNGAKDATCEVIQASIWNTSPNISPSFNNDMFVAFDGTNTIYIRIDIIMYYTMLYYTIYSNKCYK